jgi:hypothetical protein
MVSASGRHSGEDENPALTHHAAELRGRVALLIVTSMRSAAMLSF